MLHRCSYELGDAVINCTGGGATSLVTDPQLKLVKGQTVKVMAPSITEFMVAMDGPLSLACETRLFSFPVLYSTPG